MLRKKHLALPHHIYLCKTLSEGKRCFKRIGKTCIYSVLNNYAINNNINIMLTVLVKLRSFVNVVNIAVNFDSDISIFTDLVQNLHMFALASADQRRDYLYF